MKMQQTELASGNSRMICWLPRDSRVKVGTVISLAKSDDRWRVLRQYGTIDPGEINHGWKVGGI